MPADREFWHDLGTEVKRVGKEKSCITGNYEKAVGRIRQIDDQLGAILHISGHDSAAEMLSALENRTDNPPLAGIPVIVKDNIAVSGMPLTCGSRILQNHTCVYNATVIDKLQDAGAIIVGKSNMDEFAMGSSTENSAFKLCRNPWDHERVPGGSSGGSAAAVASGMVPVALGSDTGGSVRQPAAFCGLVGFKPSYGAVSRFGLVAYGSSLDQIGILSRSVADAETVFDVIKGPDGLDETAVDDSILRPAAESQDFKVIGIIREFVDHPSLEPEIRDAVKKSIQALVDCGYKIREISLPFLDETVIPAYYLTACAEASSNLSRFDGVRYGNRAEGFFSNVGDMVRKTRNAFGSEVKLRICLGTYILRAGHYEHYYGRAQAARSRLAAGFADAFEEIDALLLPTFPSRAFRIGEFQDDPLAMKLADIFTVTANLAGIPAVSLPVDLAGGLPTAVQLMSRRFSDYSLLKLASNLENHLNF